MKDTVVGRKNTPVKQNINRASKSFEIGVTNTGDDKIKIDHFKYLINGQSNEKSLDLNVANFFLRNTLWLWHDYKRIYIVNKRSPIILTLNLWDTLIFHEAIGERNASDFIIYMQNQNSEEPDSAFEKTINCHSQYLKRLTKVLCMYTAIMKMVF